MTSVKSDSVLKEVASVLQVQRLVLKLAQQVCRHICMCSDPWMLNKLPADFQSLKFDSNSLQTETYALNVRLFLVLPFFRVDFHRNPEFCVYPEHVLFISLSLQLYYQVSSLNYMAAING